MYFCTYYLVKQVVIIDSQTSDYRFTDDEDELLDDDDESEDEMIQAYDNHVVMQSPLNGCSLLSTHVEQSDDEQSMQQCAGWLLFA